MIPTAITIPTVATSSGLGAVLGPLAALGLVALLGAFGMLVVRLASDVEPQPAVRPEPREQEARTPAVLPRAA
jgi:hypothetical protein